MSNPLRPTQATCQHLAWNSRPAADLPVALQEHRHRIPSRLMFVAHSILGRLRHKYRLVTKAA